MFNNWICGEKLHYPCVQKIVAINVVSKLNQKGLQEKSTAMKHCKWSNPVGLTMLSKYLFICVYYIYFAINLKYIIFIGIINNFKWIVLYFSIFFNLIM